MALLRILVRDETRFTRPTGGKSDSNDFRFDRPDGQFIHLKSFRVNQIIFFEAVFRNLFRYTRVYEVNYFLTSNSHTARRARRRKSRWRTTSRSNYSPWTRSSIRLPLPLAPTC
jgi:hypothetical protein